MHPDDLLTPSEVATYTRYSRRTLARWRALGLIEPVGYTQRPRYRRSDVDIVLEHLATQSSPATVGGAAPGSAHSLA